MNEPIDDGGPAFPGDCSGGMSLRDWFAGQVMQGMWANTSIDEDYESSAAIAYLQADAMLAARAKGGAK